MGFLTWEEKIRIIGLIESDIGELKSLIESRYIDDSLRDIFGKLIREDEVIREKLGEKL
ncbi:hypothetical protein [Dehalobacter restrictus]|uniref:Uncharacterized protein n=1 Tax=Dehalobacter restrictus TaxID=55583 RepID=A0A857DHZ1_9FIRM|nr:hypothetical protein [Dehalobacter restrictus]QHA00537.1 hypothetical protein GQ588_07785 [Dehalobacter restrictus]